MPYSKLFRLLICGERFVYVFFRLEPTDTYGVLAASFKNGAQTWRAPLARARAFDHRHGRRTLDARCLHENESWQDVCSRVLGDERFDAAGTLRGNPPHYESCAREKGK